MKIYDKNDRLLLDIDVDDNSYRYRAIMGDNNLTLHYSLSEHIEIPIGAYCDFEGERYYLKRPEQLKMHHTRYFEYTLIMESSQYDAKIWKFRNTVDGRLKFSLTAKPREHLQMLVDNMCLRDSGWVVGNCIEADERLINYDHAYCWDALNQIAEAFKTEFEIANRQISLGKVERNVDNPLPLSYGKGNGFKTGVARQNLSETPPVEILFVQGGTQNIDPSKYGASELHLPKWGTLMFDGSKFEDEEGFVLSKARKYVVDDAGLSVRRDDKQLSSLAEDSLDCSSIYPKRTGSVSSLLTVDASKNFYDFVDASIPSVLDYEKCKIDGEKMTVIFQSGMLAGREFEVNYIHEAKTVNRVKKPGRRFEIVPQEIDGQTMPNDAFKPEPTDQYVVLHCMLPEAYINAYSLETPIKQGAEWDLFREAVRYMYDHEEQTFTFTGTLDGLWAKRDWTNIGGRIVLGGYVLFSDNSFQQDGVCIRIIGIKDNINNPHCPEIELSNETKATGFSTTIRNLESQEVSIENNHREALQFAKRRFRDAQETMSMLSDAMNDRFSNAINPLAVQTMQAIVGDESLQFRFIEGISTPLPKDHGITFSQDDKKLHCPASVIQHLSLGIKSISSSHGEDEYLVWSLPEYTSARLVDPASKYYLYARVNRYVPSQSKSYDFGAFILSETAKKLSDDDSYYYLLVGVLNSEFEGERSFVPLYGFTEILPSRVTTDKIVSGDGNSYFDMLNNAMKLGDCLDFNSDGSRQLRLKGTLVQSQSGHTSPIGCYRGAYNPTEIYYCGDEVSYTLDGCTSTYRYIYPMASTGIIPIVQTHWEVVAKGQIGSDGLNGTNYTNNLSTQTGKPYLRTAFLNKANDWNYTPYVTTGIEGNDIVTVSFDWEAEGLVFTTDSYIKLQFNNYNYAGKVITRANGRGRVVYTFIVRPTRGLTLTPDMDGVVCFRCDYISTEVDGGHFKVWNFKVELGTNPTPVWTPAMADHDALQLSLSHESHTFPATASQVMETTTECAISAKRGTSSLKVSVGALICPSGMAASIIDNNTIAPRIVFRATQWLRETSGTIDIPLTIDGEQFLRRFSWSVARNGQDGVDGIDGGCIVFKYAKRPEALGKPYWFFPDDTTSRNPYGWYDTPPSLDTDDVLWMIQAKVDAFDNIVAPWSDPVRISGLRGATGAKAPIVLYRGQYNSDTVYYGNASRVDCVKNGSQYFITKSDAPNGVVGFKGINTNNTNSWSPFGASFENIATGLLLAENANIANLIFRNERLESQGVNSSGVPNFFIDGYNNIASFVNGNVIFSELGAKIGWIDVVNKDLVGYDENGVERLRFTASPLPEPKDNETSVPLSMVAYSGATHVGASEQDFEFEQTLEYAEADETHDKLENDTLSLWVDVDTPIGAATLDLYGVQYSGELFDNNGVAIPAGSCAVVFKASAFHDGRLIQQIDMLNSNGEIAVPAASRIRINFTVKFIVPNVSVWHGKGRLLSMGGIAVKYRMAECIIARDGFMAVYNSNFIRMHSTEGFEARFGRNGIKIDSSGIKKIKNGVVTDM